MSLATRRLGYRGCASLEIPSQSALDRGSDVAAGGRVLKLETNTVVWTGKCRDDGASAVFKMYRNRGCVSWRREKIFRFRVEREYQALSFLDRHGIRCSLPIFWNYGRDQDHGRYEILCMREIPGAIALTELVAAGRGGEIDYAAIYDTIRRMHTAGFYHGRLDPRNILVGADGTGAARPYVIDTPQAMLFPRDITGTKMAWLDLRQISGETKRLMGTETCRSLLARCGLDARATAKMIAELEGPCRHTLVNNLLRFAFGLRCSLALLRRRGA